MTALVPQGSPVWVHGTGSALPVFPTGYTQAPADRAYLYTNTQDGNATIAIPPGWTAPSPAPPAPGGTGQVAFCYKDLSGTDTLPTLTWSSNVAVTAICVVTRGNHAPIATCVEISRFRVATSTTGIFSNGVAVSNANDFLMFLGYRQKGAASNGATVSNLGGFTPFVAADVPAGANHISTINYWQQTTATSLQFDAQTVSIADFSVSSEGWTIVFKTLAAASAGFTVQPNISATTAIPAGQYTLAFTPTSAGTFYAVALAAGAAAPSLTQIKAGQDSTGAAASAAVNKAVTGADSAVLGGALANPLYDLYCVFHAGAADSAVVALPAQYLLATAGRQFTIVTGAPAAGTDSILSGAVPAVVAGDVIESDLTTAPGNFGSAMSGTGVPEYLGDTSRQSFNARVYQFSSATWSAPVTEYINDLAPRFLKPPTLGPLVCPLNTAIAPVALGGMWTSSTGDPITVTAVSGLPPGLVVSGSQLVGAGTVQGIYTVQLLGADLAGNTDPGYVLVIVGNVQVPAPLKGLAQAAAQTLLAQAYFNSTVVLVPHAGDPGLVFDSTPAEGSFAPPLSTVILSVSTPLPVVPPPPPPPPPPPGQPPPIVTPPPPPIQQPGTIVSRSPNAGVQLILCDLFQYWGNDLTLSNTQDLLLVSDTVMGQQRVLRRLLTNPGDYLFQPDYGAGLPQQIGQTTDIPKITALIRSQILLEAAVAKDPAPVITVTPAASSTDASAIAITIAYTDAPTGLPQTLSFSLSKTLH